MCTAGRCRSPIAAALLEQQLGEFAQRAVVRSGGLRFTGEPMPPIGVSLMAERGIDLSGHVSHQVTEQSVTEADIILGMTREHVREIVNISPDAWTKAFSLTDFVRRVERVGPRGRRQRITSWLDSLGDGRDPRELFISGADDDIQDPYGRRARVWAAVITRIYDLTARTAPALGLVRPGRVRDNPNPAPWQRLQAGSG